jgi:hypothetical protein
MVLLFAKWQVSWLLPGSASSQGEAPVTFLVRCTQKAITVAGTAPVFHRIPSLPSSSAPPFLGHGSVGITICAANLQQNVKNEKCFNHKIGEKMGIFEIRKGSHYISSDSEMIKIFDFANYHSSD